MADKIQQAHRKITNQDSRTLRDAFNNSQISNRGYISQRNLNSSGMIIQTEPSLPYSKNRNRSSCNTNSQLQDAFNYNTHQTQERNEFDE